MGESLFAARDLGFAFAVVMGIGLRQPIAVRRSMRRGRPWDGPGRGGERR